MAKHSDAGPHRAGVRAPGPTPRTRPAGGAIPWATRRPSPSTEEPATTSRSTRRSRPGIVLTGTEIKSLRAGKVNLSNAYARIERDEAWLVGAAHRAVRAAATATTTSRSGRASCCSTAPRSTSCSGETKAKGQTIVPLRLYINERGRAKIELGLARGKQLHDRRRDIADRDARRDVARELADAQRGR